MKRLLAFQMAALLLLSAAGCSNDTTGSTSSTETTKAGSTTAVASTDSTTDSSTDSSADVYDGPTGELTWCSWGSDTEIEYNQKMSEAFMASHPGTTVTLETFNDDYATAVETRYIGGQSPDVIYGHPSTLYKWIQEGMLMDISDVYENNEELWDEDKYLTNTYDLFKYEDKYYGTVAGADSFVLFYNRTKLDEAGLPYPDENSTWEDIAEMARATTKRDEDGIPITLGMADSFYYYNSLPIIYSFGGQILDDMNNPTKVVFDSPETVEALTWLQSTSNGDDAFSPVGDDSTYLTGWFATGDYTFMVSGVYDIVYLTGVEDFEWDIAPLPQTMQKEGDTALLTAGYAVSSQTENPELAKEFVRWMTTDEAQRLLSGSGIFTVANLDVAKDPEVLNIEGAPEHHSVRVETIPYGQNLQGQALSWEEMMTVYGNYMYQLYEGTITPEECARAIQAECEVLLANELAGS